MLHLLVPCASGNQRLLNGLWKSASSSTAGGCCAKETTTRFDSWVLRHFLYLSLIFISKLIHNSIGMTIMTFAGLKDQNWLRKLVGWGSHTTRPWMPAKRQRIGLVRCSCSRSWKGNLWKLMSSHTVHLCQWTCHSFYMFAHVYNEGVPFYIILP